MGCTRFSTDISVALETTCLNDAIHTTADIDDELLTRCMPFPEDRSMDRRQEEMELNPRALDPTGYKWVYTIIFLSNSLLCPYITGI